MTKAGRKDTHFSLFSRMCVQSDIELQKCNSMRRAAYARDIRPEMECVQEKDCILAVRDGKADMLAVRAKQYHQANDSKLQPVVYEDYAENDVYVAIVDPALPKEKLEKAPL